jgi:hypothetical protein
MGEVLNLKSLERAYSQANTTPSEVISRLYPSLSQEVGIFVTLASLDDLLSRCRCFHLAHHLSIRPAQPCPAFASFCGSPICSL